MELSAGVIGDRMRIISQNEYETLKYQAERATALNNRIEKMHAIIDGSDFRDRCDDIFFEDRLTQLINIAKAAEARVAELEKRVASNAALVVERDQCHVAMNLAGVASDAIVCRVKNLIAERDRLKSDLAEGTKVKDILAKAVNETHRVFNDANVAAGCIPLEERARTLVAERNQLKKEKSDGGCVDCNVDFLNAHFALDEAKVSLLGTLTNRVRSLIKREAETAEKLKEESESLVRANSNAEFWKQHCDQARDRLKSVGCDGMGLNNCASAAVTLIANLRNRDAVLTGLLKEVRREILVYEDGSASLPKYPKNFHYGLPGNPTSLGNWVVRVDTMLTGR